MVLLFSQSTRLSLFVFNIFYVLIVKFNCDLTSKNGLCSIFVFVVESITKKWGNLRDIFSSN